MNYIVVFEKSATGCGAYVPDLPGVVATAHSKEEAQKLIREATFRSIRPRRHIEFHIEGLREDKLPIPEPNASAEIVSIPAI